MTDYTIFYRGCNSEINSPQKADRPSYFNKKNCFNSLIDNVYKEILSLGKTCSFHVLFDGEDNSLLDYINTFNFINVHRMYLKNNSSSLINLYKIADTIDTDNFYFVEDDYLHRKGAGKALTEGLGKFGLITLYDHMDRYTRSDDITKGKEEIQLTNSSHWRTSESTTCTWAASKEIYEKVNQRAKNLLLYDREFFRQNYLQNQIRLWVPIPGYSSHVHDPYQTPLVNWKKINNENK